MNSITLQNFDNHIFINDRINARNYPSQKLVDEMVALFDDSKKGPSARIDYARVLKNAKNSRKKNVFSKEVRQDLKDMKDNDGIGFDPDFEI